ncbi:MAG: NUDIX hydrolase [Cyanobacteria bacterium HKST-UBA01]|nr:NUDIX hydrolase [Cyanobacteria bacterium HKST-UBA01]
MVDVDTVETNQNPWQIVSTREIYDNAWINVREDEVIRPDGEPGIYGVLHFKNMAIGVLPIDKDGGIYLVGQHRYPLDQYSWEIPEGGCPENEDPFIAAQRELLEETGLSAGNWEYLGTAHLSNSVSDEVAHWYIATDLVQGEAQPEGCEDLTVRKVPFKEALAMVISGEITDSLSVMAIQSYAIKALTSMKG